MQCRLKDRSNSYTYENHVSSTVLVKNDLEKRIFCYFAEIFRKIRHLTYKKQYYNKYFIFRNGIITSFSERVHDPSTNLSIKTLGFENMRVSNCNQLATNIVTIDNSLIIIMLGVRINCF